MTIAACLFALPVHAAGEAGGDTGSSGIHPVTAIKHAAQDIGHGVRKGAREVGHGFHDGALAVGHGARNVTRKIGHSIAHGVHKMEGKED